MRLLVFTQESCPKCPEAKRIVEDIKIKKVYYNIDEAFGLGESMFWDIMSTPSIILVKNNKEIKGWRGIVPTKEEICELIK